MVRTTLLFAALFAGLPSAQAQDRIALTHAIYVESIGGNDGSRTLEPAAQLRRGDRVVLMIDWSGAEARKGTMVQSAIPSALKYQRSSVETIEVSVDGGRNWGRIGQLRMGERIAWPEEVTHLRMRVTGTRTGRITYSAIVR